MRRRVVHLIDTGGPGGAETVLLNIVRGLDPGRWESVAIVPVIDWLDGALRRAGVEPVLLSTHGSFDHRYLRRLTALCRQNAAVIHAHLLTTSVYGAVAGALTGVPLVCTFHGLADISGGNRFRNFKFRIIRGVGRASVVFVSESLRRDFLTAVPLDASRTAVVPNGIDASRFRSPPDPSLRRALGVSDGELLIGAIGNIRPSKSYDVLLRAAAVLRGRGVRFRLIIVGQGSGPLQAELDALHARLGLGDLVRFTGFRDDVPRIMGSLDVYVSSSSAEGFSLTTVEAMASGIPVLATRSGGPEDIVEDGVTGLLVPTDSPDAIAHGLETLLRDPLLRRRLAAAARDVAARQYTIPAMVRRYEQLYDRAIDGRSTSNDARAVALPMVEHSVPEIR